MRQIFQKDCGVSLRPHSHLVARLHRRPVSRGTRRGRWWRMRREWISHVTIRWTPRFNGIVVGGTAGVLAAWFDLISAEKNRWRGREISAGSNGTTDLNVDYIWNNDKWAFPAAAATTTSLSVRLSFADPSFMCEWAGRGRGSGRSHVVVVSYSRMQCKYFTRIMIIFAGIFFCVPFLYLDDESEFLFYRKS